MNKVLEKYLGEVEKNLKSLPISERVDIIREIKSSITELESEGVPSEEIITRLGNPKDLANAYLGVEGKEEKETNLLASVAFYMLVAIIAFPVLMTVGGMLLGFGIGAISILITTIILVVDQVFGLGLPFIAGRGDLQYWVNNIYVEVGIYLLMSLILFILTYLLYKITVLCLKGVEQLRRKLLS
ncbi:MAG: DUF1700 domain-containing protein [Gemella sp.]|nr:DUF1700 domain-containing protein [Gemella sp.]